MKKRLPTVILMLLISSSACAREPTQVSAKFGERDPGTLTVGSEIPFEPFEFEDNGKLTGFDVELIRAIAKDIGLKSKFVRGEFDNLLADVAAAKIDVAASAIRVTESRMKQVSFTNPYYLAQQALVVNATKSPEISSIDDLKAGSAVAVQGETTGLDWAEANLPQRGIQLRPFPEAPDMYDLLEEGNVVALISDEPSALTEVNNRAGLKVVQTIDTGDRYAFAVNPELATLLEEINKSLQKMIDNGTYDRLYAKYEELGPNGSVAKNRAAFNPDDIALHRSPPECHSNLLENQVGCPYKSV